MGPRPIGRGRPRRSISTRFPSPWLQWGRARSDAEDALGGAQRPQGRGASMGPRPIGRGRQETNQAADTIVFELQWGRARSDAEDRTEKVALSVTPTASMGPRPIGRGRPRELRRPVATSASMGPRPIGRGRPKPTRRQKSACSSFNGAAPDRTRKTLTSSMSRIAFTSLQWGRARSDAEDRQAS